MGYQVIGDERSRLPGKRTVGEVRRGGRWGKKPATERRTEYTDLGLDLGERDKQVIYHASALALAMTDERKQRCKPDDDLHHFCELQRKPYVFH